jgi:hypothetical protein
MKKEKSFLHHITIEIIVIFIGISLALLIDNFKDNINNRLETKSHFNLISKEFSKDILELTELEKKSYQRKQTLDSLCYYLEKKNDLLFNQHIMNLGSIRTKNYFPRLDEINFILNSSSFASIYNEKIFNDLNNLKSDCFTYLMLEENENQLLYELKNEFIYENLDYQTKRIKTSTLKNKNFILNKLSECDEITYSKSVVIGSILAGYSICIEDVNEIVN